MHRRVSVEVFPEPISCDLPAYDYQLDTRTKSVVRTTGENYTANIVLSSMQDSLSHQLNETICSDLEEFCDRLATVEVAMELTAKEGENTGAK